MRQPSSTANSVNNTHQISSYSTTIPWDIIYEVVNVLGKDPRKKHDLQNFARVSRSWNIEARKHIFKIIRLHSNNELSNPFLFNSLIQHDASTSIAPCIRTLHIYLSQSDIDDQGLQSELYESMSKFRNLQLLSLCGQTNVSWGPLQRLITFKPLQHLQLSSIHSIPLNDLVLANNLRSLELEHVSFQHVSDSQIDRYQIAAHCWENLETLTLRLSGSVMGFLLLDQGNPLLVSLGGLRKLVICVVQGNRERVTELFRTHHRRMASIESLHLSLDSWAHCLVGSTEFLTMYDEWILSLRATLKHLKTSTLVINRRSDPFSGLIPTLKSLRHENVLEALEMIIIVSDCCNVCTTGTLWRQLIDLFLGEGWQHLRKVQVNVEITVNGDQSRRMRHGLEQVRNTHLRPLVDARRFAFELNVITIHNSTDPPHWDEDDSEDMDEDDTEDMYEDDSEDMYSNSGDDADD